MENLLLDELNNIQKDYLYYLKELDKIPQHEISFEKIDLINIYWYEKRNLLNLVFDYLFKNKDTYCFSAATYFGIDDKSQYSYFLLGDYHIFDDPIPNYLNTINGITDKIYLEKMQNIISKTIKDNIRIIEELNNELIILPLRYLSVIINQHHEQLDEIAEKLFCNLFNGIENINEYKEKVRTMEDFNHYYNYSNPPPILLYSLSEIKFPHKL